jgi:hypothetical protein
MANSLNTPITTTYAGEFAGEYIAAALLSGVTLDNGGITVKPNVKYKEVIKTVSSTDIVADAGCDFDATADAITLNERIIQPKELQVNLELCKQDFRSDWEAVAMGYSAFDNLPPKFSDFILAHVAAKVAERTEQNIWTGDDGSVAGDFDGLLTQALAAGSGVPAGQQLTAGTVTAANVIDELGKIVDVIPSTIYGKDDLHIYVSQNIARAYVRALGGFGAQGLGAAGTNSQGTQWYTGGSSLSFDGVKLFVANGLGDNSAMAAQKGNLYFGTGLMADSNEVKLLDMADIDGSQNVRIVMRYTAGTQFGIASEIVTYS